MAKLGIRDSVEDILITLDTQYHVIRPISLRGEEQLFFYVALNRAQANLAMARRDLRTIVDRFYVGAPDPTPVTGVPGREPAGRH
ncbi:hypothetical protein [Pseudonocardia parietis]|uniref:Uncharacterized protein n=1 Tax=Pseudonocardia parietis TaxID=570936 RepID=A0ABS4VXN8_9PSEU|nr:hypothetical protein [Pseudonocardia parietis]MBP2368244.1 hypothetical protein [Pseudonocardia parietis]